MGASGVQERHIGRTRRMGKHSKKEDQQSKQGMGNMKGRGQSNRQENGRGQIPDPSEISPVGAVLWADAPWQVLRQACQHLRAEISTAHSLHF